MTRNESIQQLCFLVLDIPDWYGNTEEYVYHKLNKSIEEASDDEITDLLMEILPNGKEKLL
jgi:hypothetical protein